MTMAVASAKAVEEASMTFVQEYIDAWANLSDAELMQYLFPVDLGPSSKT